jgi:hypothetical protein
MEDIDVGMPDASAILNRETEDDDEDQDNDDKTDGDDSGNDKSKKGKNTSGGGITLSGLLNAIVRMICLPKRQSDKCFHSR